VVPHGHSCGAVVFGQEGKDMSGEKKAEYFTNDPYLWQIQAPLPFLLEMGYTEQICSPMLSSIRPLSGTVSPRRIYVEPPRI
jgi:hypothetical protein